MSETTTADDAAMTAMEIRRNCQEIIDMIGGAKADVKLLVTGRGDVADTKFVTVMCFPEGNSSPYHFVHGAAYPEAFAKARQWAAANGAVYRNGLIRRMALAIIEITDEHGHCSDTLLLNKGFWAAEITAHVLEACERASEMAGNKPFAVTLAAPVREAAR